MSLMVAYFTAIVLTAAGGVSAQADDNITFAFSGSAQAQGVPAPWGATVSSGKLICSTLQENDETCLKLRAERASFFLSDSTRPFDPRHFRYLSWSWKATTLPTGGDVRTGFNLLGNRNDQAVQVLVAFEGNNVLSYVWDTTAPLGAKAQEPSLAATIHTTVGRFIGRVSSSRPERPRGILEPGR
ncbi:MAG: DUF3047 domain-containing protein [Planctomycetaceae bacterium]|nr:DUF3047 domain-containing protein [Planctomycetaceae bacterium]